MTPNEPMELTKEQKSEIAEYAAGLGDFDFWYYDEEMDTYNSDGGTLDECIEFIRRKMTVADEAREYLKDLGLVKPEPQLQTEITEADMKNIRGVVYTKDTTAVDQKCDRCGAVLKDVHYVTAGSHYCPSCVTLITY